MNSSYIYNIYICMYIITSRLENELHIDHIYLERTQ